MILKTIENVKYDTLEEKARGILIDEFNNLYLSNIENSYLFPGGGVEESEDYNETIIRELSEEAGIKLANLEEIGTIIHYHENFPNLKRDKFDPLYINNRINVIHYFFKRVNSKDFGETHYTEYEINNHLTIKKLSVKELLEILNLPNENTYKKFTDEETKAALELAIEKGYIEYK